MNPRRNPWWYMWKWQGRLVIKRSAGAIVTHSMLAKKHTAHALIRRIPVFLVKDMLYILEVKEKPRQFRISVAEENAASVGSAIDAGAKDPEWKPIGLWGTQEELLMVLESYLKLEESA